MASSLVAPKDTVSYEEIGLIVITGSLDSNIMDFSKDILTKNIA